MGRHARPSAWCALAASLVLASPAFPQGVLRARFGAWEERCEATAGSSRQQCALMQRASSRSDDVTIVVVALKPVEDRGRTLRVIAPLGVLLTSGVQVRADGTDLGTVGFARCLASGCVAEFAVDDILLSTLRSSTTMTFVVARSPSSPIAVDIATKGIGEGLDGLP